MLQSQVRKPACEQISSSAGMCTRFQMGTRIVLGKRVCHRSDINLSQGNTVKPGNVYFMSGPMSTYVKSGN